MPPSIDPDELTGVELLGSGTELDLEALATTEPDLIIGMAFNTEEILDVLAAVASTYTFPEEHLDERSVGERVRAVADLLGAPTNHGLTRWRVTTRRWRTRDSWACWQDRSGRVWVPSRAVGPSWSRMTCSTPASARARPR